MSEAGGAGQIDDIRRTVSRWSARASGAYLLVLAIVAAGLGTFAIGRLAEVARREEIAVHPFIAFALDAHAWLPSAFAAPAALAGTWLVVRAPRRTLAVTALATVLGLVPVGLVVACLVGVVGPLYRG